MRIGFRSPPSRTANKQSPLSATLKVTGALVDDLGYGSTSFVKTGAGTMRLTSTTANEFTGSMEIVGGTLRVDDLSYTGSLTNWHALGDYTGVGTAQVMIDTGATLALAFTGNYAFSNAVSGSGNLTVEGPGIVAMNSDNSTFTGVTTLAGGRTVISRLGVPTAGVLGSFGGADQTDASTLVFAGGSLEYTGSAHFTRKFTVKDGGAGFYANATNTAPFLVDGASQVSFDPAAVVTPRPLMLGGDNLLANTFNPTAIGSPATGRAFTDLIKNGVGTWIINGSGSLLNADTTAHVNAGLLGFTTGALGGNTFTGDIILGNGSSLRWEVGNYDDLSARLKVAAGASANLIMDNVATATVFASSMNFGTGALNKSGAGELDLTVANTFSGGLSISGGKVVGTDAGALGSGPVSIGAGTSLTMNVTPDYSFTNAVSGSGSLNYAGPAGVTLTGANTFTGVTTLTTGKLIFNDVAELGAANPADASKFVIGGGTLNYSGSAHLTRAFTVANGGLALNSDAASANAFVVDGSAQLAFAGGTATGRTLSLGGTSLLDNTFAPGLLGTPAAGQAFSQLVKNGVGQWIIGGSGNALADNADVSVNGGILGFYLNSLGTTGSAGNVNLANGSTLRWESNNSQDLGARLKVADGATATIKFDNASSSTTFNGGMSFGTGALVKSGAGELILAAANTFSGGLTVAQGKVTVNNAGALGSGAATVSNTGTMVVNQTVTNDIHVTGNGTTGGTLVAPVALGNVTVGDHGTVARGVTIGTLSTNSMTLSGGARLEFKIWDKTQAAGTGYDFFSFNGLDVSSINSANKAVLKVVSLSDGIHAGAAANMDFSWGAVGIHTFNLGVIGSGGLNLGANANINDVFSIDLSQFSYTNGAANNAGLWSLDYNATNGAITLTAVPEPSTYGLGIGALALAAAAIRRRKRQEKKA